MTQNNQATLVLIKPDGLKKSLTGNILTRLSETKLEIVAAKMVRVLFVCVRTNERRHSVPVTINLQLLKPYCSSWWRIRQHRESKKYNFLEQRKDRGIEGSTEDGG